MPGWNIYDHGVNNAEGALRWPGVVYRLNGSRAEGLAALLQQLIDTAVNFDEQQEEALQGAVSLQRRLCEQLRMIHLTAREARARDRPRESAAAAPSAALEEWYSALEESRAAQRRHMHVLLDL